jgi:hypothetical protein
MNSKRWPGAGLIWDPNNHGAGEPVHVFGAKVASGRMSCRG